VSLALLDPTEAKQTNKPKRLLVRVDDAGTSWSSNMGCLLACTEGIAKSIEIMMPGAWVLHAAKLLNANSKVDVGIHLTLTSEWEAMKWRPLTRAKSLVDENGHFLPLLLPRSGDERPCLAEADWSIDDITQELRAQIAHGVALLQNVSHVSSHMIGHFNDFDPRIGEIVSELCHEFNLADDALGHGLARIDGYPKFPRNTQVRTEAFAQSFANLPVGTHIFIDHPAVMSAELEAIGHKGYQDVAIDRQRAWKH